MPFPSDSLDVFLDNNYKGGEASFRNTIYRTINYPSDARAKCGIGVLKTRVYLTKEGSIQKIEMLNEFGHGVEKAVEQAIKQTNKNWIPADIIRHFDISFAYRLGEMPEIKGDIVVTALGLSGGKGDCPTEKELLKETTKYLKKKKYKKALKLGKQLLRRNPDSDHYNGIYQVIQKGLTK
jgi:hypothetical protein